MTEDQRRIGRQYIEGGPLEYEVELQEAEAMLGELQTAQSAATEILAEVASRADTGIGVKQNCVSLYAADPKALQTKLDTPGLVLLEHVCIEPVGPYAEAPLLEAPSGILFPRQHPPEGLRAEMAALLIGELIEEDGCLRVAVADQSHLVIWPYDHTVTAAEDETIQIRDGDGTVVARVGDIVRLGGGEAPEAEGLAMIEIPDRCSGPYWIAGSEIESVNLEALPNHEDVAPGLRELRSRGPALEGPEESRAASRSPIRSRSQTGERRSSKTWRSIWSSPRRQDSQPRSSWKRP